MWPFSGDNINQHIDQLEEHYDYIIVGGGTAGCVLARRLSEDRKNTVLLIERGDAADSWLHRTPLPSMHHWSDGKHSMIIDSCPVPTLGREVPLISGTGLGGSTRINGCQYTCGVPAQYNAWSQDGRKGWSYDDLKPYFKKSETWIGQVPSEYHGLDGPLHVRSFEDYFFKCSKKVEKAAENIGFSGIDMHSPLDPSIGFNKMQFTLDSGGRRESAFRAYLPKEFTSSMSDYLHICINTAARKVVFSGHDGLRAEGVEIQSIHGGPSRIVKARGEIILACGALRTPQLLMLSGVGPEDHLHDVGVKVVRHTPGVGENLEDHLIIPTSFNCPMPDSLWSMMRRPLTLLRELYNYMWYGTGWFLCTLVEIEIFGLSSLIADDGTLTMSKEHQDSFDPKNIPDFAIMAVPIAEPYTPGMNRSKGIMGFNPGLLRSKSKGRIRLRSSDPNDSPECDMQYLTAPEDFAAFRAALRVVSRLAQSMRENGYELEDAVVPQAYDDATLDEYIREQTYSMFHYSSTCRMAPENNSTPGVVDDELRVHGIRNLRIADASIFPSVPASHPQALVYAAAEKCADMIRKSGLISL